MSIHFGWLSNPLVIYRQLLAGLSQGMLLFLISAGLSLIFGVSRIINFAHGALFMLGAYLAVTMTMYGPGSMGIFGAAMIGATLALYVLGAVLEMGLLRRIYNAAHEFQLLLTFSLVFIFGDLVKLVWGREEFTVAVPNVLTGSQSIFGVTFPTYRLFLIGFGLTLGAALWLLLNRTRWGVHVRAATMDRQMLNALGVNTRWLFTGVFALGAGLAGLGGAMASPIVAVSPALHIQIIIDAFIVVVIGGMGSVFGALTGSLLVGIVNAFGILAFPGLAVVLNFAVMTVVLIIRPWGLFGRPE